MPKCIECGLKTWFRPLDCRCKAARLKERARPVQEKRQYQEPTKPVHPNPKLSGSLNNGSSVGPSPSDIYMQQNLMMPLAQPPEPQPVTTSHCHTSHHHHHDSSPAASYSDNSYSCDTSPSYSSES